jgi:deoxyribose-phosphate aldolase
MNVKDIAGLIDHTALGPDFDEAGTVRLCAEAKRYGFHTAFVPPCRVKRAVELLAGSGVGVGSVAGFPFGYETTKIKAAQAATVIGDGASDVDMVINIGWIKDGLWPEVTADINETVQAARAAAEGRPVMVKVIIEACLLTDDEKRRAALAVQEAGANFVKTSTGYSTGGAVVADVVLLREAVGYDFGVKAAGGIRKLSEFRSMIDAGADRIGTSASVAIIEELETGDK